MTNISSVRSYVLRLRAMTCLSLAFLFVFQSSANAFVGALHSESNISLSNSVSLQNSDEVASLSDARTLQAALLPIENRSIESRSFLLRQKHAAVSMSVYQNRYRQFARFIFAAGDEPLVRKYQAYELDSQNNFGRLIEAGYLSNGQFIRERIYDYKSGTVVLYNPKNVFEKRIYELREDGEVGRPVQYRGRNQFGDLVNLSFFYQADKVVCLQSKNKTFSIYAFKHGALGRLLEVGTAQSFLKTGEPDLARRIIITQILRNGESLPVYIFREVDGAQVIRERVGGSSTVLGSMGRVLRFVSHGVDLEYFYEEARVGRAATVRVLNHRLGESLTFEVKGGDLRESCGRLAAFKDTLREMISKAVSGVFSFLFKSSSAWGFGFFGTEFLPIYIRSNYEVLIWEKLLRGPPAFYQTFTFQFRFSDFLLLLFPITSSCSGVLA